MPTDHELNSLIAECWVDLLTIASRERARYPEASDDPASLLGEAMTRVLGQSAPVENAMHLKGLTTVFLRRTAIDRIRRRRVDRKAKAALRASCEIETRPSREREEMRADALAESLEQLAAYDERKAAILTLSYACGLDSDAIAQTVGTSKSTVNRELVLATAWISARLTEELT